MLPITLIEKALALTSKTISDVKIYNPSMELEVSYQFSIEKFCYYLLSPEFIEKYTLLLYETDDSGIWRKQSSQTFGIAIYEYQLGNESPLVELLSII